LAIVTTQVHHLPGRGDGFLSIAIRHRYRTHYLHALGNDPLPQRQQDLANIQAAWSNAIDTADHALLRQSTAAFAELLRGLGLVQEGGELLQRALAVTGVDVVKDDGGERNEAARDEVARDDEAVGEDEIAGELAAALLLEISSFVQVTVGSESALTAAHQGLRHTHNPQLRAKLYSRIARLLGETAAWQAAEKAHGQAEAAARRTGDNLLLAGTIYEHAHTQVIHFVGDFQQAIQRLELTLSLIQAEPAADTLQIKILRGLAMAHMRYGNYGQARGYAQQCLSLAEQQAVRLEQIDALNQLSLAAWFAGLYDDALHYLQAALSLAEEVGDREAVGIIRRNRCLVQRNIGNLEVALVQGQAALVPLQESGMHRFEGLCRNRIGHTLLVLDRSGDATIMYTAALALWQRLNNPNRFEALAGLAAALQHQG
jgi:tetratricopeptide (TPR) repeat protein